jgi:Carboxypeptidase regulatory-like domain
MGKGRERTGRRIAVWAIGSLAFVTGSVGVAAAVTSTGGTETRPAGAAAAAAAAEPTPTTTVEQTTTSTTAASTTTSAPATTTTPTVAPRPVPTATTVASLGAVAGRVTYHSGQPVPGAKLTLSNRQVFTDNGGSYRFDGLAAGNYDVVLFAESPAAQCAAPQPCVGSAVSAERRTVVVRGGETDGEDWVYPYDSSPAYS